MAGMEEEIQLKTKQDVGNDELEWLWKIAVI
jgi:hypothetical protein